MSTVTRTAPTGAANAEGAAAAKKKARQGVGLSLLAWVIGILFVLPVVWLVLTSFLLLSSAGGAPGGGRSGGGLGAHRPSPSLNSDETVRSANVAMMIVPSTTTTAAAEARP